MPEGPETPEVERPGGAISPESPTQSSTAPASGAAPGIIHVVVKRSDDVEVEMTIELVPDYVDSDEGLVTTEAAKSGRVEVNGLALDTRESFKGFLTRLTRSVRPILAYCYDTRRLLLYERLDTMEPIKEPVRIDLETYA